MSDRKQIQSVRLLGRLHPMDFWAELGMFQGMEAWRIDVLVARFAEGATFGEAARAVGWHRTTLWRMMAADLAFAERVKQAREEGKAAREYRLWLRHPFRGLRPPTGKGRGGAPRFSVGW